MFEKSTQLKIPIIYAFARSGGTLINRCLGCIPGNIVLSEVNPHAALIPIEIQARDWFNLLSDSEFIEFSQKTYAEKIGSLTEVLGQQDRHLIIRDWTTINFLDKASNDIYATTNVLEQELYLSHHNLARCPIVLTRRSADVYESITRTFKHLQNLSVREFGVCYLAYAQAVSAYPVFHYESFCREPEKELKRMCEVLDINYCDTFMTEFSKFTYCTGDNTLSQLSRGAGLEKITVLKSNQDSESYIVASLDTNCLEADKLLGYETMEREGEKQVEALWKIVDCRDQALRRANDLKQQTQVELERSLAQQQQTQAELERSQTQLQQLDEQLQQLDRQLQQNQVEFQAELERSQVQLQQLDRQLQQNQVEFQAELERSQVQLQQLDRQLQQSQVEFQAELERSLAQRQEIQAQRQETQAQLQQTQAELEDSRMIIQGMESSKFWKVRNVWLRLQQIIKLSSDK